MKIEDNLTLSKATTFYYQPASLKEKH